MRRNGLEVQRKARGESQAHILQFYPLLPILNCPLPITLPSSLPSTLFPNDIYQKDERARNDILQSTKDYD